MKEEAPGASFVVNPDKASRERQTGFVWVALSGRQLLEPRVVDRAPTPQPSPEHWSKPLSTKHSTVFAAALSPPAA